MISKAAVVLLGCLDKAFAFGSVVNHHRCSFATPCNSRTNLWSSTTSPLDIDNKLVSAIMIFDVKNKEEQDDLVGGIQSFVELVREEPGFLSASIHKSLDATKVVNYAQWESADSLVNFRSNPTIQNSDRAAFLSRYGPPDSRIYDIFAWEDKENHNGPVVHAGPFVHVAEFDMLSPDLQPKMEELAKEHLGPAMKQEGLISAAFHKSHDGMKVINYGQWENMEAIENLKKQPGFSSDKPYWEGLAINEHHLYELVEVVHKE